MYKRLKLGIIFNFNPSWMGGIIYILNLIKTLDFLDDEEKPEIILFYRPDLKKFVDQVNYPYIKTVSWQFPDVYTGYLKSWCLRKNVFIDKILSHYDPDALYPLHDYPVKANVRTKLISWYADLQHKHYPEFFSKTKIFERTLRIKYILRNSEHLVISSNSVASDFKNYFWTGTKIKMHIYHFVSVTDDISNLKIDDIRHKYNLPSKYFMVSNQFHKHKNHKVLLLSLTRLKAEGKEAHLVLTGRFPDATHSPYMQELHNLIDQNDLKSSISFLGVIPRNEQLLLMKYSQAVIQPSLFEGWSTVIEDAISLQVPVIASSIPVNIEQLGIDANLFDPHDSVKLAGIISNFPERNIADKLYEEYSARIKRAAGDFLNIVQS
jgi:glycosyltransferase involved in cell wall biosynthesis